MFCMYTQMQAAPEPSLWLQLQRLPSATPLPAELAAREFMSIEGVGEATATVLALTHALGGTPHPSLQSLQTWAKRDGGVELALFLLTRSGCQSEAGRAPPFHDSSRALMSLLKGTQLP